MNNIMTDSTSWNNKLQRKMIIYNAKTKKSYNLKINYLGFKVLMSKSQNFK